MWVRLRTVVDGLSAIASADAKNLASVKTPIATAQRLLAASPSAEALEDIEYHLTRVEQYSAQWRPNQDSIFIPPKWATDTDREAVEACRLLAELKKLAPSLPVVADAKKEAAPKAPRVGKPRVFIGSSTEGLPVAKHLQVEMEYDAEVTIWHQGVFGLSGGTLDSLVKVASNFDFAVLVLTPDDVVTKRDRTHNAPRDNVLFELGLLMGALGRERTYIVHPRVEIDLPSDLAGITPATFDPNRSDGNLQAALGAAATKIVNEIRRLGCR